MTLVNNTYNNSYKLNNFWEYCFNKGKENANDLIKKCAPFFNIFDQQTIKTIDDVDTDNLRSFLIAVLKAYKEKGIKYWEILNLADTLEMFFIKKTYDFDRIILNLKKEEQIGFHCLNYILGKHSADFIISSHHVEPFISFLKTPCGYEDQGISIIEKHIKKTTKTEKEELYH